MFFIWAVKIGVRQNLFNSILEFRGREKVFFCLRGVRAASFLLLKQGLGGWRHLFKPTIK